MVTAPTTCATTPHQDDESEGSMLQAIDDALGGQLLRIARDPDLRQRVYEHLREYCHQCRNRLNSLKLSPSFAQNSLWLPVESTLTPTTIAFSF